MSTVYLDANETRGTTTDPSLRTVARVAGLAYLIPTAILVFVFFGIHGQMVVAGDVAATARNILAHERLFRVSIVGQLFYCAGVVMLLTALYVILAPVSRGLALLATLWKLVYVLVWVAGTLSLFDTVRLLGGAEYTRAFEPEALRGLAQLYLGGGFDRYYAALLFYALGGTVGSYLWLRSGYIPRVLAVAGIIAFAWCAACAFAVLIDRDFTKVVNWWLYDSAMGAVEMATSIWLVVKGIRIPAAA